MAKMKLALVQFESVLGDVEASIARALPMVDEAAAAGADMVVFPELFTTGYHLDTIGPHMTELAQPIDGPAVRAMQAAARKNEVYLVAPMALYHELPGVPYNSCVFIDPDGSVQGTFDKVHLWALERFYFRAGYDYPVFETEFGRVGIMICYDIGFPETARILTLKGAELLLCPSAWHKPDRDVWDINIPARALENTVFVAAVNRYGLEGGDLYMDGASMVCGPRGQRIARLEEEAEGILYADIDFDEVRTNRTSSPYLRDRRPETYDEVLLP